MTARYIAQRYNNNVAIAGFKRLHHALRPTRGPFQVMFKSTLERLMKAELEDPYLIIKLTWSVISVSLKSIPTHLRNEPLLLIPCAALVAIF